ncbi:ABC transporter ATP-binding protein [Oceanirhabdus sp. W0125-5]|uniref:ABC transporter ATP-binding protein n=1 Tax=Oceanirhabdus sp. W0125-5 TaxID=2999116 RepID=UPI0022F2BB7B|nr:ABC transporter ATP-binding protein [Oceanirhabdus sp. W0125-5]WBW97823.1 ABC transporter ATP-binding protein [Oceanirhabdus sp. W0125-5]
MTLEFIGVGKRYGKKTILKDINIEILDGDIVGIIGGNGAGKSTLLSLAASASKQDKGDICIKGNDIYKHIKAYRNKVGYVPQKIALFEELTVKDNLLFWGSKKNNDYQEKLIKILKLEEWMKKKVKVLSGGTKRRLNIAVGLMKNPEIIIMDEPMVGIELGIKKNIYSLLKEMAMEGRQVLLSTHEMWGIEKICNKIIILKEGSIVFYGYKKELQERCLKEERLFGDMLCEIGEF